MQNETSKTGDLLAAAEALNKLAQAESAYQHAKTQADLWARNAEEAAQALDGFTQCANAALLAAGFVRADHDRPTADAWNTDDLSAAIDAHAASAAPSVPAEVAAQGVREYLMNTTQDAAPSKTLDCDVEISREQADALYALLDLHAPHWQKPTWQTATQDAERYSRFQAAARDVWQKETGNDGAGLAFALVHARNDEDFFKLWAKPAEDTQDAPSPVPTPRFVDALGLDAARAQVRPLVDALRSAMRLAGNAAQVFALHNEAEQLSAQCADASEALAHLSTFLHGLGKDSEQ